MTFDEIGKEGARLTLGDFVKLCNDFGIQVRKETLNEIYRVKVKRGNKTLEYKTFKVIKDLTVTKIIFPIGVLV